jgi:hydroxyacylglutathione hydrolase
MSDIKTISYGSVNCYLIKIGSSFILIDTGLPNKRSELEKELQSAGCRPENLKLIILTHGDYDHAGNADYLRKQYAVKIAMHREDWGRVERGDWNWGLKAKPDKFPLMYRVMSFFIRPGKFDSFKPDIYVEDGQSLLAYGCEAQVLHLPGHTRGSIGILTAAAALFCGDLMDNMRKPDLEFFIDDLKAAQASITKLRNLKVTTVYPGHGKSFSWEQFLNNYR